MRPFWTGREPVSLEIDDGVKERTSTVRGEALGIRLGLPKRWARRLAGLRTPERIQDFINALAWNHEREGPTARSVVGTLEAGRAHCVEAAFVAAASLWLGGRPPLVMDLGATGDVDHVVALFQRHRHWGAISKSNSANLRYREPIHRSLRELAISFFPQYYHAARGTKTLRTYSVAIDLRRHDPATWVTWPGECHQVVDALTSARHFNLLPPGAVRGLRPLDPIELKGGAVLEYPD
jgi:hypothetical protein